MITPGRERVDGRGRTRPELLSKSERNNLLPPVIHAALTTCLGRNVVVSDLQ